MPLIATHCHSLPLIASSSAGAPSFDTSDAAGYYYTRVAAGAKLAIPLPLLRDAQVWSLYVRLESGPRRLGHPLPSLASLAGSHHESDASSWALVGGLHELLRMHPRARAVSSAHDDACTRLVRSRLPNRGGAEMGGRHWQLALHSCTQRHAAYTPGGRAADWTSYERQREVEAAAARRRLSQSAAVLKLQQAQRLRANACTLSGSAMRPLFGDQRSDEQSSPRSVQSSPRQPSSTPSSRSASKTRNKLRTGGLQVDEEKLTKFVAHFGKVYVSRSFRSWSSWRDSKREKLVKVNAVAKRWFLKAANACFRKWERILEEEKARKMNEVASWQFYNTRIQADALRVWRSQKKHLLRGKQLAQLVQTGIRRMGMHPGPRRLLTMVVRAWRQLLDEQKARAQGGLATLCFAVRYCAWPRPAPAVLIAMPTPSSAVAEGEEAAAMAVSVLLAEPTPNSAAGIPIADGEEAAPAATDHTQALHEA